MALYGFVGRNYARLAQAAGRDLHGFMDSFEDSADGWRISFRFTKRSKAV